METHSLPKLFFVQSKAIVVASAFMPFLYSRTGKEKNLQETLGVFGKKVYICSQSDKYEKTV